MPFLGCGLDRLQWSAVKKLIAEVFADVEIIIAVRWIHSAQVENSLLCPDGSATSKSDDDPVSLASASGFALVCAGGSDDKSRSPIAMGALTSAATSMAVGRLGRTVLTKLMRRKTTQHKPKSVDGRRKTGFHSYVQAYDVGQNISIYNTTKAITPHNEFIVILIQEI